MDKKTELKFIENGYDPEKSNVLNIKKTAYVIERQIYPISSRDKPPAVLFDGRALATIEIGKSLMHLDNDSLTIQGGENSLYGAFFLFNSRDGYWFRRNSVYIERESEKDQLSAEVEKSVFFDTIKLKIKGEKEIAEIKIDISKEGDTKPIYIPRQLQGYKRLEAIWKNISDQTGLDTDRIEIENHLFYNAFDIKTGIRFILGTEKEECGCASEHKVSFKIPANYPVECIESIFRNLEKLSGEKIDVSSLNLKDGFDMELPVPAEFSHQKYAQDIADYINAILDGAARKIYPLSESKEIIRT